MMSGIVTLTTDFGATGPYVAAMKGVLLNLAPGTQIIDVSHSISPQNILEGAFVLAGIVDAFPAGTIHLAVVDPGVGTDRRLVAARMADQWFVLPDNGLISGVLCAHAPQEVWEISNPDVRRAEVSSTFHGRDILAPAAAHLLRGLDPAQLGRPVSKLIRLSNFEPTVDGSGYLAEVIFRDTFGNLITNLNAAHLGEVPANGWVVEVAGRLVDGLSRTYGDQPSGSLIAVVGSGGWVEIAVVNGDAARQLTAGAGTSVWLRRSKSASGS